jgi:hypothetical protein
MAHQAGRWFCPACGHKPNTRHPAARTTKQRRGVSLAAVGFLLVAAGLAVLGFWLLSNPEAESLLRFVDPKPLGPSDDRVSLPTDGVYHRRYDWTYKGRLYSWEMNITAESYEHFRNLERPQRRFLQDNVWHVQAAYDIYVSNPDDDPFMDSLARAIKDISIRQGFTSDESLSFALSFVQSLPYTPDSVTTGFDEYPRYPLETLVDYGGDCEDSSILYASLVLAMGYGAVMLSPPGHMGVGVAAAADASGTAYMYHGQKYLYAETTGDGYRIGDIPDAYRGASVTVFDLAPKPLFSLSVTFGNVTDGKQELFLRARQTGSAAATGVQLVANVGRSDGTLFAEDHCDAGQVRPGAEVRCRLLVDLSKVPRRATVVIRAFVQDERFIYDEAQSTPWVPRP